MKLVKSTSWRTINTSIDGVSLSIGQQEVPVEDSVAEKLSEQFLHEISVSEVEVVAPQEVSAPQESVESEGRPVSETNE